MFDFNSFEDEASIITFAELLNRHDVLVNFFQVFLFRLMVVNVDDLSARHALINDQSSLALSLVESAAIVDDFAVLFVDFKEFLLVDEGRNVTAGVCAEFDYGCHVNACGGK